MNQRLINPWKWQDRFGFSQAIDVSGAQRMLFCAGQTATAPDGTPQHAGDMRAQLAAAMDNLETVLANAGLGLHHVVRLNVYTTDVDRLLEHWPVVVERLRGARCQPSSTLLGVSRLASPDLLVELEATAVA